jgi:hypothetical protein
MLRPQRLSVAGRRKAASELPRAASNHLAVERVDLRDNRFGFGGRVVVVEMIDSN